MLFATLALGFNAPLGRPAVSSRAAHGVPAINMAVSTPPATEAKVRGVPMTGDVLKASLKMRCDTSGAAYAIYWANIGGDLKVVGEYKAASCMLPPRPQTPHLARQLSCMMCRCGRARKRPDHHSRPPLACPSADQKELKDRGVTVSFGQASKPFVLDAYGTGPIATVLKTGEPYFVEDAVTCNTLQRRWVASILISSTHLFTHTPSPSPSHVPVIAHPSTPSTTAAMLPCCVAASLRPSTASSR